MMDLQDVRVLTRQTGNLMRAIDRDGLAGDVDCDGLILQDTPERNAFAGGLTRRRSIAQCTKLGAASARP
jgi:hypothetical protein